MTWSATDGKRRSRFADVWGRQQALMHSRMLHRSTVTLQWRAAIVQQAEYFGAEYAAVS